jgi:type I restriction enzyme S subunit
MAAEWQEVTIGDLCDAGAAVVQTGPFGSQLHADEYLPQGVPVVPTEAIRNRQIDWSVLPQISKEKAKTLSRHLLQVGDILFARRGIQATGHIGYIRQAEQGMICGTGAILLRVKKPRELDSEFLSHVLADPRSIEWFKFHAVGATMPNLNDGIIRSFRFLLPQIEEQRRIAAMLSAMDDRIELCRELCGTLEELARAIFKSWFVDFDPVRAKAEGREPEGMDADTAALFPSEFEDSDAGLIPQGWTACGIDTIAAFLNGIALQKYPAMEGEEWLPAIKIAQLKRGSVDGADRISPSIPEKYIVQDGDLLFSWSGSLEVEFWTGGKGALNQHLFKVSSEQFPHWFVYLVDPEELINVY